MPRVEVYLDEELVRAIEDYARRHNTNKSTVIRILVERYLPQLDPEDFELQLRWFYFRVSQLSAMMWRLKMMEKKLEKLEEMARNYPISFRNAYMRLVREMKETLEKAKEVLNREAGQDVRELFRDNRVESGAQSQGV